MLAGVGSCWQLLAAVGSCWQLLAAVGRCWQLLAGPARSGQTVGSLLRVNHEQAKHSSGTTGANMLNKEAGELTQEVVSFNFCLSSQPSGRIN